MSLTIFDGLEPERLLKDMVANLETESKLLWASSALSIPLNNCSWLLIILKREFGGYELNYAN